MGMGVGRGLKNQTFELLESDKGLRVILLNYPSVAASMPALLQLWQCMAWPSPQLRWKINHHREPENCPNRKELWSHQKKYVTFSVCSSNSNHLSGHWRSRRSPTCCATETCWGTWQSVWLLYSWNWWADPPKICLFFIFKVGFVDWQCCSDEYVHIAEEQAHP